MDYLSHSQIFEVIKNLGILVSFMLNAAPMGKGSNCFQEIQIQTESKKAPVITLVPL